VDSYTLALLVDVPTLLVCALLVRRYADFTFSHPATPYFVFHIYAVTLRLLGLAGGSPTLFTNWIGWYDPITPEEIARASLYCDAALVAMTSAWIWFRAPRRGDPQVTRQPLRMEIVLPVVIVSFLLGVAALAVTASVPGMEANTRAASLGAWSTSSYIAVAQTWPGLAVLAYIYCYGFRRGAVVLLIFYFVLIGYQGFHRFRIVIPIILLVQIWLDRRGQRWPSGWMAVGLLSAALVFFPLKIAAKMAQEGATVSEITDAVTDTFVQVGSGEAHDQKFLDELACSLSLLDLRDEWYWGKNYLALLTLPIPRQWWPDKPMLYQNIRDISIPSRPMAENGMTSTYVGEAYANLGFWGVILLPWLLAAALTVYRRRAYQAGYGTVMRLSYVLLSANLIQVYRDGFASLFIFTFVNMLPLMLIVFLHVGLMMVRKRKGGQPLPRYQPFPSSVGAAEQPVVPSQPLSVN
jgi:hypothetical protein